MARDHRQLTVFRMSDELVVEIYRKTKSFPIEERFGLQSVPANIVEGCTRHTTKDYLHFMVMALGSASELNYFIGLAERLEMVPKLKLQELEQRSLQLVRSLQKLINSVRKPPN